MSHGKFNDQAIRSATAALGLFGCSLFSVSCEPRLSSNQGADSAPNAEPPSVSTSTDPESDPDPIVPPFPETWKLVGNDGRTVDGKILAKYANEILFLRFQDQGKFLIPLEKLTTEQQLDLAVYDDFEAGALAEFKATLKPVETTDRRFSYQKPFHPTLDDAKLASENSGRPILLLVTGESVLGPEDEEDYELIERSWNQSVALMSAVFEERRFRSFIMENFEPVLVDYMNEDSLEKSVRQHYHALAYEFELSSLPCLLVVSQDNEEEFRIQGYDSRGPNVVMERLEEFLDPD